MNNKVHSGKKKRHGKKYVPAVKIRPSDNFRRYDLPKISNNFNTLYATCLSMGSLIQFQKYIMLRHRIQVPAHL